MSQSKPAAIAHRAFIGLGSNLGDRLGNIARALERLGRAPGTDVVQVSSMYATEPVGKADQPEFFNAVAELRTGQEPGELLDTCLAVERELGRVRRERWGPRTIDLDILVYDELRADGPRLQLPHPRMCERAFVLIPLAEIAPGLVIDGRTAEDRAEAAGSGGVRILDFG